MSKFDNQRDPTKYMRHIVPAILERNFEALSKGEILTLRSSTRHQDRYLTTWRAGNVSRNIKARNDRIREYLGDLDIIAAVGHITRNGQSIDLREEQEVTLRKWQYQLYQRGKKISRSMGLKCAAALKVKRYNMALGLAVDRAMLVPTKTQDNTMLIALCYALDAKESAKALLDWYSSARRGFAMSGGSFWDTKEAGDHLQKNLEGLLK